MQRPLAIFLAMMLTASCLTAGITAVLIIGNAPAHTNDVMPAFTSYGDLSHFLDSKRGGNGSNVIMGPTNGASGAPQYNQQMSHSDTPQGHSETNVRTNGIDEEDMVKTDGQYIYSARWDSVAIIKAYPPEDMSVVSCINYSDLTSIINATDMLQQGNNTRYSISIFGLLIVPDKLIVLASVSQWRDYYYGYWSDPIQSNDTKTINATASYVPWSADTQKSVVLIFDVSDPSKPTLDSLFASSGSPVTSRLQGNDLYLVSQIYILKDSEGFYNVPRITDGSSTGSVGVTEIRYDPEMSDPSYYIIVLAVDLSVDKSATKVIVGDWASVIYKSVDSLFLTFPKWHYAIYNGPTPLLSDAAPMNSITTTIYKVSVDGLTMNVSSRGDVKGTLDDQFSIDEYGGFLRVAVNSGVWGWGEKRTNAVFVLNSDLEVVGALEDLAVNETIQAARFVGDTLYLVTFRQIDPLFVIDLSNPSSPKVIGELTMPGFSSFLLPVDATHLLGIGRENSSVKVSLYDVSDSSSPKETSKYIIEGYSSSIAQWDYKAILFDAEKGLLVIPASTYSYFDYNYSFEDGFYVFHVSTSSGIELKGVVDILGYTYYYYPRALYIGDYLYMISDNLLKVVSLSDLSQVASVQLPGSSPEVYYYMGGPVMVA